MYILSMYMFVRVGYVCVSCAFCAVVVAGLAAGSSDSLFVGRSSRCFFDVWQDT